MKASVTSPRTFTPMLTNIFIFRTGREFLSVSAVIVVRMFRYNSTSKDFNGKDDFNGEKISGF